jgi:hypothetical protein
MTAAQKTERRGTIAICIAAATIALAAPAHADDSGQAFLADLYKAGTTVCASMGNGMTHAQENCSLTATAANRSRSSSSPPIYAPAQRADHVLLPLIGAPPGKDGPKTTPTPNPVTALAFHCCCEGVRDGRSATSNPARQADRRQRRLESTR